MKDIKQKEYEYQDLKNRVKFFVEEKYRKLKKDDRDKLILDGTLTLCVKYKKGYDVNSGCIPFYVAKNDLRGVIDNVPDTGMANVRRLFKIMRSVRVKDGN